VLNPKTNSGHKFPGQAPGNQTKTSGPPTMSAEGRSSMQNMIKNRKNIKYL